MDPNLPWQPSNLARVPFGGLVHYLHKTRPA